MSTFALPQLYDQLGPAARRLARVPRYNRLMAILPPQRFTRLNSEAATFWEAFTYLGDSRKANETGLLDDGLRPTAAKSLGFLNPVTDDLSREMRQWQTRLAFDMLSAIAFEMFCGRDGSGVRPPIFEVYATEGQTVGSFLKRALGRLRGSGAYRDFYDRPIEDPDGRRLDHDWKCLQAMDARGLKYFLFGENNAVLRFNDISTQTFLAACWASRWANDEDRQKVQRWILDPDIQDKNFEVYDEFWRLVCELPGVGNSESGQAIDPDHWHDLLAPCYDGSLKNKFGSPVRSTELIYRSWPGMLQLAGSLTPDWNQTDLLSATRSAQRDGRGLALEESPLEVTAEKRGQPTETKERALRTIHDFLGEFVRIRLGAFAPSCVDEHPTGKTPQAIAEAFEQGFRQIPDNPAASLEFWMSSESLLDFDRRGETERSEIFAPFLLSACPVTNELYQLFDPHHQDRFGDYLKYSPDPTCPAIRIDWYDAWCVALWLGGELPTEHQWEYACRGKPGLEAPIEKYWCGNNESDLKRGAWYNDNSNGKAQPVGRHPDPTVEHPFGLFDMAGNVWEWTASWYADNANRAREPDYVGASRVLRGGSFLNFASFCRSADRNHWRPTFTSQSNGVRVARALPPL